MTAIAIDPKADRKNTVRFVLVCLLGMIVAALAGCSTRCESGAVCGENASGPSTVIVTTTTTTPSASPSPSATPGCVAQTASFVCSRGASVFEAILLDVQRTLPASPEPIYIVALVAELNKRVDVCAIAGPSPDEVTIKGRTSNALSATWDVVRADGVIQAIPTVNNICIPSRF